MLQSAKQPAVRAGAHQKQLRFGGLIDQWPIRTDRTLSMTFIFSDRYVTAKPFFNLIVVGPPNTW